MSTKQGSNGRPLGQLVDMTEVLFAIRTAGLDNFLTEKFRFPRSVARCSASVGSERRNLTDKIGGGAAET